MKNYRVTLVISDHSKGANKVYLRIKEAGIFEKVLFFRTQSEDYCENDIKMKIQSVVDGVRGKWYGEDLCEDIYDIYLYYNDHVSNLATFSFLERNNRNLECYKFEESLLSYGTDFRYYKKQKTIDLLRILLHKNSLRKKTSCFYCFEPKYYMGNLEVYQLPRINNCENQVTDALRAIFLDEDVDYNIHTDYIFLASIGDDEGGEPIGEYKLIDRISKIVGKRNLTIKAHPRMDTSRYENQNYIVYKMFSVPWEVIQMNIDMKGKILLSASSSGLLSINAMMENPVEAYYMYPLCNYTNNYVIRETVKNIEEIIKRMGNDSSHISVIHSWKEFEKIVNKKNITGYDN